MWYIQGIRNRKEIDNAVRARNGQFPDPLPEKDMAYFAYAIGYGNRAEATRPPGIRLLPHVETTASGGVPRQEFEKEAAENRSGRNRAHARRRVDPNGNRRQNSAATQSFVSKVLRKLKRLQSGGGEVVSLFENSSFFHYLYY